jgi:heme/copper-type cytochrome/quinol oxidase subunit 2
MKIKGTKVTILTIIFLILSIYLIYSAFDYRAIKEKKWISCEEISDEEPDTIFTKDSEAYYHEGIRIFARYVSCLNDYGSDFMMYRIYEFFALVFISLTVLSWKFDNRKSI